jgi:hypothetical protein
VRVCCNAEWCHYTESISCRGVKSGTVQGSCTALQQLVMRCCVAVQSCAPGCRASTGRLYIQVLPVSGIDGSSITVYSYRVERLVTLVAFLHTLW